MAFIHHTVDANSYSASEAPSKVLGICRYHRNTLGWNDMGTDRSVVGAQTQGFNSSSTGVANLGTHTSSPQTSAGMDAMARLLRWKLDVHGLPRGGYATLTSAGGDSNRYPAGRSVTFKRISGHRDAGYTACPGDALYAQLPSLRGKVEAQTDTTAPTATQNLAASSGPGRVALNWSDNGEADLAGYRIYRRTPDTNYASIATTTSSAYTDRAVRGGETYYYRVKAYDSCGNHSASSNYATGRPWVPYEQAVDKRRRPALRRLRELGSKQFQQPAPGRRLSVCATRAGERHGPVQPRYSAKRAKSPISAHSPAAERVSMPLRSPVKPLSRSARRYGKLSGPHGPDF